MLNFLKRLFCIGHVFEYEYDETKDAHVKCCRKCNQGVKK